VANLPMRTGTADGPTSEVGYSGMMPVKWSMWTGDMQENVPDLRWPMSVKTLHAMRTDAQLDALMRAVDLPIRRARWVIDPNKARDEVVEVIAADMGLPIRGVEDPPPRGRRKFKHDAHLRHALLAKWYGFMFNEKVGEIRDGIWRLTKAPPRMPQSIKDIDTSPQGELNFIKQYPQPGDPFQGKPIPANALVSYVWDMEGADWTGRSFVRACYRNYVIKDRLIRVDAMKNERFGMGIPYSTAPKGASQDTIRRYAAMSRAFRADANAGIGLPADGDIGIEGVRGSLPDILASLNYHDEQMARNFLAMMLMLGSSATRSGSRALGEAFVDFFKLGVDAVAGWYKDTTQSDLIEPWVDWNWGQEETVPLIDWDEDPESRMDATDLVSLIDSGAIVVDDELRTWISDRWGVADPAPGTPTPPGPSNVTTGVPATASGEPVPVAATRSTSRVRHGAAHTVVHGRHRRRERRAAARSQTLNSDRVGHRDPSKVELAAKTDFTKLQAQWTTNTTKLVNAYQSVRQQQIDELVQEVQDAVAAEDVDALAGVLADTDGADLIALHMVQMMEDAVVTAKEEASAQGVAISTLDTSDLAARLTRQAGAIADIITQAISTSAATQGLQRYGVTALTADDVGSHVRTHLESLSDSYLNDQLGGALTQAQNAGRVLVMGSAPGTAYASELLDENTCDECAAEDGTVFDTIDDAVQDYPAGGYSECAGGPRCRGTIVMVYTEASSSTGP
jgi:hypothetical protein